MYIYTPTGKDLQTTKTGLFGQVCFSRITESLKCYQELKMHCLFVDECALSLDDCDSLATCVDISVAPGYRCDCNSGYYGDGMTGGTGCQGEL